MLLASIKPLLEEDADCPVPEAEREKLKEFARGLAALNLQVNTMRGVERGILVREFERETQKLEKARYG